MAKGRVGDTKPRTVSTAIRDKDGLSHAGRFEYLVGYG